MADQSQTANTPTCSEPTLCKSGCGFFGNGATNNFCSKCWGEQSKKQGVVAAPPCPAAKPAPVSVPASTEPEPMSCEPIASAQEETMPPAAEASKKKKKKKASYKNMMKALTQTSPERDVDKEKEQLRKVTGGGAFSKIEKI